MEPAFASSPTFSHENKQIVMITLTQMVKYLTIFFFMLSCYHPFARGVGLLDDVDSILFVGNSNVGSEGGLHHHFRRTVAKASPPVNLATDWVSMYGASALDEMYTDELVARVKNGQEDLFVICSGADSSMRKFVDLVQGVNKKCIFFAQWSENPFLPGGDIEKFRQSTNDRMIRLKKFEQTSGIISFLETVMKLI